ncbi:MAG TPA: TonB-dependent receptor [Terriglobales bacterium]|nr:TonB-dependent receptor [Terriglobales bacterium]
MVFRRTFFGYAALASLLASVLVLTAVAQNVGTVIGTITDPTGAVVPGATVSITSSLSGYRQTVKTDNNGQYKFTNVPFAQYTIHVEIKGFHHADKRGELRTNVPVTENMTLELAEAQQEVTVTEQAPLLETTSAGTHHDIDQLEMEKLPLTQSSRGMAAIVQTLPGVVKDDNGRMHARGSESQVQYVVDGVPITENLAGVFSTALSAGNMRSAEVITGNVPAEYGDKVAAVVMFNTKSGLEMPWQGSIGFSGGSFDTAGTGVEFGGHVKKFGVYVNSDVSRSRRYLDPPEIANFHNTGGSAHLFSRFDYSPTDKDNLRLSLSTNGTDFRVPNRLEQQELGQNVRQELRDDSQSFGWDHVFNNTTLGNLVIFRRSSTSRLLDPLETGFPFHAEQNRRLRNEGFRANLSREFPHNSFKTGIEAHRLPITERFMIAATDPAILEDPSNPASHFSLSNPFSFRDTKTGKQFAWYVQDRFKWAGLTADMGIRYDHYDLLLTQDAWSPRIGLAYYVAKTGTVVRASYNRLFQTPPVENLLISSSQAGAVFSGDPNKIVTPVPPERQNFYEVGLQQQLGHYVRLDLAHYVKNIRNISDKDQFLDTGIIFPVAVYSGDVRGYEVRLDLAAVRGFTGFLSYANAKANNTTPLNGGLFLGTESDLLLVSGLQFPADHDQRNTGSFGVTYTAPRGWWSSFTGRYDSGVASEVDPQLWATLDPRLQENLDPVRGRVKPRATFDIATGYTLRSESRMPIDLQLSVTNLFDRFYLYNFESVFSGTHIGRPREVSGRIVFRFSSAKPEKDATTSSSGF